MSVVARFAGTDVELGSGGRAIGGTGQTRGGGSVAQVPAWDPGVQGSMSGSATDVGKSLGLTVPQFPPSAMEITDLPVHIEINHQ